MKRRKIKIYSIVALELLFIAGAFWGLMMINNKTNGSQKVSSVEANVQNHQAENQSIVETVEATKKEEIRAEQPAESTNAGEDQLNNPELDTIGATSAESANTEPGNIENESSETVNLNTDIILVNKDNRLPEDYSVTLKTLPDGVNKAAEEAHGPLCDMLKAGRKEGLSFEICSSYRSVERQQELLDEDINKLMRKGYTYEEAYLEVTRETMPPGHSEHSTGLAFDIVSLGYQMLDKGQERTAENKWLQEHCAEYGFILRYPKGKEDITQINYESWHYRYVGVEVAEYIMEKGITLEEYLEEISKQAEDI